VRRQEEGKEFCRGNLFCRKGSPGTPSQRLHYQVKVRSVISAGLGILARADAVAPTGPKPPGIKGTSVFPAQYHRRQRRRWYKIMGVFGEGSGEALFAKRASPEALPEARRF